MAAWTARIENISDGGNFESVAVYVVYYDAADSAFSSPLWQHTFSYEAGTTLAQIAAAIKTLGQQQRAVADKVAQLQPQLMTTIAVP